MFLVGMIERSQSQWLKIEHKVNKKDSRGMGGRECNDEKGEVKMYY